MHTYYLNVDTEKYTVYCTSYNDGQDIQEFNDELDAMACVHFLNGGSGEYPPEWLCRKVRDERDRKAVEK